jgi:hypothetical protein
MTKESRPKPKAASDEPELRADRAELKAAAASRHQQYQEFLASIKNLPNHDRALSWLTYVTEHCEEFGDQEAIVALLARGQSCDDPIKSIIDSWKTSARQAAERGMFSADVWVPGSEIRKKYVVDQIIRLESQTPQSISYPTFGLAITIKKLTLMQQCCGPSSGAVSVALMIGGNGSQSPQELIY